MTKVCGLRDAPKQDGAGGAACAVGSVFLRCRGLARDVLGRCKAIVLEKMRCNIRQSIHPRRCPHSRRNDAIGVTKSDIVPGETIPGE